MKHISLTVEGASRDMLVDLFEQNFQPVFSHSFMSDDIQLFVLEKFYYRTFMEVAGIVSFQPEGHRQCRVTILAAAGQEGDFDLFRVEKSFLGKLRDFFVEAATVKGWTCRAA